MLVISIENNNIIWYDWAWYAADFTTIYVDQGHIF